jgi:hypothetical protein
VIALLYVAQGLGYLGIVVGLVMFAAWSGRS